MSEKTYSKVKQDKIKPTPEDIINKVLTGENRANALDIIYWLRENKMTPSWQGTNKWRCNIKGKTACYIIVNGAQNYPDLKDNAWCISLVVHDNLLGKANDDLFDSWLKELTLKNVKTCMNCCNGCAPGIKRVIYGKEFQNFCGPRIGLCGGIGLAPITNPDTETLNRVKELLLLSKDLIIDMVKAEKSAK